jgi:hypothetical protein
VLLGYVFFEADGNNVPLTSGQVLFHSRSLWKKSVILSHGVSSKSHGPPDGLLGAAGGAGLGIIGFQRPEDGVGARGDADGDAGGEIFPQVVGVEGRVGGLAAANVRGGEGRRECVCTSFLHG